MGAGESHPACSVVPGSQVPRPAGRRHLPPPTPCSVPGEAVCLCILASSWLPELLGSYQEADFQLECPLGDHVHSKHSQAETSRAGSLTYMAHLGASLFSSQHKLEAVTHQGGRGRGPPGAWPEGSWAPARHRCPPTSLKSPEAATRVSAAASPEPQAIREPAGPGRRHRGQMADIPHYVPIPPALRA